MIDSNRTDVELISELEDMPHTELVRIWRFADSGSPYIARAAVFDTLKARIKGFGGITPDVSKEAGWDM